MLTIQEKRDRTAAELAEIKQRIVECDQQVEQLRQRRLALLETGLRLEGRIVTLDEMIRDAAPADTLTVVDAYIPASPLGEEH